MSFKLKTQMRLLHKLSMTTELQHSINLLTLSHQEIKEEIQKELLENPVLQTREDNNYEDSPQEDGSYKDSELKGNNNEEKNLYENNTDNNRHAETENFEPTKESQLNTEINSATREQDSLNNWKESHKEKSYIRTVSEHKDFNPSLDNFVPQATTLKDHLVWQAQVSRLPENIKTALPFLIFNLDEQGYLRASLEEIAKKERIKITELTEALSYLHTMDPLGVGSRSIQECLLLQARHLEEDTTEMVLIIKNHLKNVRKKNYRLIADSLGISIEEVFDCCQIIKTMEPFPARNFSTQPTEYVTPDVYLYKEGESYRVSLNDEGIPDLIIDKHYKKMLSKQSNYHADMKKYVKEKIKEGSWFIRAFSQRQMTIRKVTESIIKHQMDFLERGSKYMKPLILQDVASDVSVHISTISRVTANKYISTPRGVLPFKYFFSTGIINSKGETVSLSVVKQHISEWIEVENDMEPISDQKIVDRLKDSFHLVISRRAVGQYRDCLGIPPMTKRKKIAHLKQYSSAELGSEQAL